MQLTQPPLPKLLEKLKSSFLPHVSLLQHTTREKQLAEHSFPLQHLSCCAATTRIDKMALNFILVKCHEDQDILLND